MSFQEPSSNSNNSLSTLMKLTESVSSQALLNQLTGVTFRSVELLPQDDLIVELCVWRERGTVTKVTEKNIKPIGVAQIGLKDLMSFQEPSSNSNNSLSTLMKLTESVSSQALLNQLTKATQSRISPIVTFRVVLSDPYEGLKRSPSIAPTSCPKWSLIEGWIPLVGVSEGGALNHSQESLGVGKGGPVADLMGDLINTHTQYENTHTHTHTHTTKNVIIKCNYLTQWGKNLRLVGGCAALGWWNPCEGAQMRCEGGDDRWIVDLDLPLDEYVEYKIVLVDNEGGVHWEQGPNQVFHKNVCGHHHIHCREFQ
eukprot:GHVR01076721.1.p1 GENE.GHVR01076721.1~~GHVR01076721.1.p1  ORF type:complete len:312 (-),score=104.34 GHVR01076721.1:130-1065(-)